MGGASRCVVSLCFPARVIPLIAASGEGVPLAATVEAFWAGLGL